MRIAFIVPSLVNTGPIIVVHELCVELVAKGHFCKIFFFDDKTELEMPCPTERIGFWHKIDFKKWDVVHSHCLRPDLYIRMHRPLIRRDKTLFVSTLHTEMSYSFFHISMSAIRSFALNILWKTALTAMDEVVVLNGNIFENTCGINRRKLSTIHLGRNISTNITEEPEKILPIVRLKQKYRILGTVSRIDKNKNIIQIVRALPHLPEFALVSVGDGPELESLKRTAEALRVDDRCRFVGYDRNPCQFYKYFDIFVMCSRFEGFSLSLIEAAAHGKAVLLSDIPTFKSIITDKEACFFRIDDDSSFTENVYKLISHRELYSSNIKVYYNNSLTAARMAEEYLKLYSKKRA